MHAGPKYSSLKGMNIFNGACKASRHAGRGIAALSLLLAAHAGGAAAAATSAAANRAAEAAPAGMAGRLIAHFNMQRIPQEGAWFAVTYTSADELDGGLLPPRYAGQAHAAGGAILAVFTTRDFSALHRLRTDEVWHFYSGAPLELLLLYPDGRGRTVTLGTNVLGGELAQFTVPKGVWQGAAPVDGTAGSFSFVGTQLAPGFEPSDFEIGYRDELAQQYPAFAKPIAGLTRNEFATVASRRPSPTEAPPPSRAFSAEDAPAVTASPGVTLQELVGRVAPLAKTSMVSVAKFTLSPGRSSGTSFNHRSQEVFLVIDGTGEVHLGDQVTPVHAGSTVFIPAGEPHSIEAEPHGALAFYAVSSPAYTPDDYTSLH